MTIPLPDIDLDSQLLLAKGAYEDEHVVVSLKDDKPCMTYDGEWDGFIELTSLDTLQRLQRNLKISVEYDYESNGHPCRVHHYNGGWFDNITTQSEIDSATIECSLAILRSR